MLQNAYKRIITFLNKEGVGYFVIGGIAVSVLGEPRETVDIDFCIFIKKSEVNKFLEKAQKNGYIVEKQKMLNLAKTTGTFNIKDGLTRIDFIIASHELERSAFSRKREEKIFGLKTYFPSPEDLILLKIIPGRTQDIADAEKIAKRHKDKLDKKYILDWATKLSDEAQDSRIYNQIKKLLSI